MIYNKVTGHRMEIDGELKAHYAKLVKDFPEFENGESLVIRSKNSRLRKVKMFIGKSDESAREVGTRELPPPSLYAVSDGHWMGDKGVKNPVIYSEVPPVTNAAGKAEFIHSGHIIIDDGMSLDNSTVEKAIFLYCFSTQVDGGVMGSGNNTYEFSKPDVIAEQRLRDMNGNAFENEIVLEKTRMSYDKIKEVMEGMGIAVKGKESVDRLNLYDRVKNGDEGMKVRYEKAKQSAIKELPKYDLSSVAKLVKDAKAAKVIYEGTTGSEKGHWMFKKSDVASEKIDLIKGTKVEEKEFALKEYLAANPEWVETIKEYL